MIILCILLNCEGLKKKIKIRFVLGTKAIKRKHNSLFSLATKISRIRFFQIRMFMKLLAFVLSVWYLIENIIPSFHSSTKMKTVPVKKFLVYSIIICIKLSIFVILWHIFFLYLFSNRSSLGDTICPTSGSKKTSLQGNHAMHEHVIFPETFQLRLKTAGKMPTDEVRCGLLSCPARPSGDAHPLETVCVVYFAFCVRTTWSETQCHKRRTEVESFGRMQKS